MELRISNFDYQEEALYHDKKYGCFAGCRQSGKTEGVKNWICENLLETKDYGLWVDTTHGNIEKYVYRYFKPILEKYWRSDTWNAQKKILTLPNGYKSTIDFGSSERPELLEGFNYGFVVVNEAGIALKKPQLWYNTLQPMTKRAKVRFVGTPKGKNLFYQLFQLGLNDQNPEYKSFKLSGYDSPLWSKEQLDNIRSTIPEQVFSQEYMAEFLDNNAGVFRNVKSCVKPIPILAEPLSDRRYVIGIDLAKHTDFTVVIVADSNTREIVYFDRFNQMDWVVQKQRIIDIWQKFSVKTTTSNYAGDVYFGTNSPSVMIDSTGVGDPIFDDLKRVMGSKISGYVLTNSSKKELIEGLSLALQNTSIYYPEIPELLTELDMYEYEITRSGNVTYNAPDGFHDDCVIALALVWELMKPQSNQFGFAI